MNSSSLDSGMPAYNPVPITTLETKRLVLRPLKWDDAPRIQEQFSNPNVLKYMASVVPFPYPEHGAEDYLGDLLPKIESQERYGWAITLKEDPTQSLIGVIELSPASTEDSRGFWIAEPYWGKGLMKEANLAVNDFAFGPLGMKEMILNNAEPNRGSQRLKELAGAEILEKTESDHVGGKFVSVRWRLTAENWQANRHRFLD